MKKMNAIYRIYTVIFCLILMLGGFTTSVSAAKEMFSTYEITSVSISGIDTPEAGKYFDFTAEESSQKYDIIKVVWKQQYRDKFITDTSAVVQPGIQYSVCVILEVATPDHHFKTGEGRVSAVPSVTVNGQTAHADNTQDYELFSIDASKYEHDTTYKRFLRVWYTFPEVPEADLIENFTVVIDPLTAGELPANKAVITTVNGGENVGYINVDDITWSYQDGRDLPYGTPLEYGEDYTVVLNLSAVRSRKYATDPNHFLASPGNPFPAVTAAVNGKNATVLPNGDASAHIIVSAVLTCEGTGKISEASVSLTPPKAGEGPDYNAVVNGKNYTTADTKDRFTSGGVTWYNETEKKSMYVGIDNFEGGNTYSVTVELEAAEGYTFSSYAIPASINGKSAEIEGRDGSEAYLHYTFEALPEEKHICSPIKADEVKASCETEGKKTHYFCSECGKFFEDAQCTKEITDISRWGVIPAAGHTGGKATCAEKAKCKTCGVSYGEFTEHNYGSGWDYRDASGHAHTCKVCGAHDPVKAHTGGTAKCGEKAKCAECKAEYGEIKAHVWSTAWDYKDTKGHAHKCTVCGEHDSVQSHTGGTADCMNKAKCSACGIEYGKTGEHKWGTEWDYTDTKGHAHKCMVCGDHDSVVKHTPGPAATETSEQLCTSCNYVIEPKKQHTHQMIRVDAVDAACTTDGKKQYYTCSSCGLISSDSRGEKEISDPNTLIVPASGHKDSKWQSDADCHWKECTVKGCGAVTAEKETHEFNKSGKCTVCGYQSANTPETSLTAETEKEAETEAEKETETETNAKTETKSEETTVIPDNPDTPEISDSSDISTEETVPNQDTAEGNDPEPVPDDGNSDHDIPWMLLIAAAAAVVVCVVVITVVIIKRNMKK